MMVMNKLNSNLETVNKKVDRIKEVDRIKRI